MSPLMPWPLTHWLHSTEPAVCLVVAVPTIATIHFITIDRHTYTNKIFSSRDRDIETTARDNMTINDQSSSR